MYELVDYALRHWHARRNGQPLPDYFVSANKLAPEAHLAMQAAIQPFVDNAISKTINVPNRDNIRRIQIDLSPRL